MEISKIEFIETKNLVFDPLNPRLPSKLKGYNKEDDVLEWMIMYENVIELMGSIGEKGYFTAEPLLVIKSSRLSDKYEVIEGNRRLAAVKLLEHPSLATFKSRAIKDIVSEAKFSPKELPVIIFPKRDDILIYLGYRHITGIKEWGPLAKAKYLESLQKTLKIKDKDEEYKTLAKIIGSKSNYVRVLLAGLEVYKEIENNDFFNIKDLDEVTVEFGVLYTAIGREHISTFIGVDSFSNNPTKNINIKHLKELSRWMFEKNSEGFTRLGESRHLTDLNEVIGNISALKKFRNGVPLTEAILYTEKPLKVFLDSVEKSISRIKIARDQIHHIDSPSKIMIEQIDELIKIAKDLKTLLNAKINEE